MVGSGFAFGFPDVQKVLPVLGEVLGDGLEDFRKAEV